MEEDLGGISRNLARDTSRNTKFSHKMVNAQRRNFLAKTRVNIGWLSEEEEKIKEGVNWFLINFLSSSSKWRSSINHM